MKLLPAFLGWWLAALACLAPAAVEDGNRAADFAWFDGLGYPSVEKLTFIHYTAWWFIGGNSSEWQAVWKYGWLLEDTPDSFSALNLFLVPRQLEKKPAPPSPPGSRYEAADLKAYAAEFLADERNNSPVLGQWGSPNFPRRTQLFVLSRMCEQGGESELSRQLYDAAGGKLATHSDDASGKRDDRSWSLRTMLEDDLGTFTLWGILLDFGKPQVPRPELLARLQALPAHFTHCTNLPLAADLAERLVPMIAEDAAHPTLTAEQIDALPIAAEIREWIFQLRNENAQQTSQPGSVQVFYWWDRHVAPSPAHHLAMLGDAAVPALIEALEDSRLTRSVQYGRDFTFSHKVLPVSEIARQTLGKIAGREFKSGLPSEMKYEVETWWNEHKAKGALAELSEATARGDKNSLPAAEKLVHDFPKEAVTPLMTGADAATDPSTAWRLVDLLIGQHDERVPEFLLHVVRDGRFIEPRVIACVQLIREGRMDGVPLLAQAWEKISAADEKRLGYLKYAPLVETLAWSNSVEGARALTQGLKDRNRDMRALVLRVLLDGPTYEPLPHDFSKNSPAVKREFEDLLLAELEDDGPGFVAFYHYPPNRKTKQPRLCEVAAHLLAREWPEKYQFNLTGSWSERERERVTLLNLARAEHGQPALPLPPTKPKPSADESDRISAVTIDPKIQAPEEVLAFLRKAEGRKLEPAFAAELRATILAAGSRMVPPFEHAFQIGARQEAEGDGPILFAIPEQGGPKQVANPSAWILHTMIEIEGGKNDSMVEPLFSGSERPEKWAALVDQLAHVPPGKAYSVSLAILPSGR